MSDLRPVGGVAASFKETAFLNDAVAALLSEDEDCNALVSLALSIARIPGKDEYQAKLIFEEDGQRKQHPTFRNMLCLWWRQERKKTSIMTDRYLPTLANSS